MLKPPFQVPGREKGNFTQRVLQPNSVQLQLINLTSKFGALHPFEPHKTTIVILQLSLFLLLLKFYLYSGANLWECPPLVEGSDHVLGNFRAIVAQTL